jgi:hypothetical protein
MAFGLIAYAWITAIIRSEPDKLSFPFLVGRDSKKHMAALRTLCRFRLWQDGVAFRAESDIGCRRLFPFSRTAASPSSRTSLSMSVISPSRRVLPAWSRMILFAGRCPQAAAFALYVADYRFGRPCVDDAGTERQIDTSVHGADGRYDLCLA